MLKKMMPTILMLALLLAVSVPGDLGNVLAADYDSSRKGSITITLSDLGTEKADVGFRLYSLSGLGEMKAFEEADKESAQVMKKLAQDMEKKALETENEFQSGKTSAEGVIVFSELPEDVYLITQSDKANYGVVDPFLVAVPYMEDGKEWIYDVETKPKGESVTPEKPDEPEKPGEPKKPEEPKKPSQVKTGDEANIAGIVGIAVLAIGILAVVIIYRRRELK